MATAVEAAVDTYVRAWSEPDPTVRAQMITACFAESGRIVTRSREIRGRAALANEMTTLLADPTFSRVRVTSAIDARGTIFRFRTELERRDGTRLEAFDAGEIDDEGRIALILTFGGPLANS